MHDIPVRVCGDHWLNPEEVRTTLYQIPVNEHVILDLGTEGPSLTALGLSSMLDQLCATTGRNPETININHWPNTAEELPYRKLNDTRVSHFFWMSERYQIELDNTVPTPKLFGLFVGRRTVPRAVMLWQTYANFQARTLFSLMNSITPLPWEMPSSGIDLENLDEWNIDQSRFKSWWDTCSIPSLDHHRISDQYDAVHNTNRDLLKFYNQFDIEIVAETYTRGNTFFPTEKTIRPMSAQKPMLIYGPRYFLERLRDLGFRTWSDIWNEDYDCYEGPTRWQMMLDTMKYIASQDQTVITAQAATIAKHNALVLTEIIERYRPG